MEIDRSKLKSNEYHEKTNIFKRTIFVLAELRFSIFVCTTIRVIILVGFDIRLNSNAPESA